MDDTVAKALHAIRHHLAGGGFLSDLFSGPDYLSTGEVASPTNWGDPELASDFFKADKALRLAREAQASEPARDMPARAPLTAPRPGVVEVQELPVNIPFTAPERGASLLSSDISPASVTSLPLAYSPEAPAAPAAAAINTATTPTTDKLTARVDPNSEVERANNVWNRMLIQESGGRQFDRNGNTITSPVGALGISQVMPSTGPEAAQLAGLPWSLERLRTDPEYNHALGRAYYEAQLERFGDPTLAAAAYNGGPGRVAGALRQARETGQPWTAFLRPETQNYVRIVTAQPRAEGGEVEGYDKGGVIKKAMRAIQNYQDPATRKIADWNWRPLADVDADLGLTEIPPHVQAFGDYMRGMSDKAAGEGLTARDLIKGYTTTRASIQRRATDADRLRQLGLDLPDDVKMIRPEGAWAEWLGTPMGQRYLDAAARGDVEGDAVANAIKVMSPFGRHETDIPDSMKWAAQNLPGREATASDLVARAAQGASAPEEWRQFTSDIRGVGPSKSGFLASLYGRGDQPTLDARQIILNTGEPTKLAAPFLARSKGEGGVEAVDRLAARQSALGLQVPSQYDPFYQHLAHHSIWDKASNEMTTHGDVVKAMQDYASGGLVDDALHVVREHHADGEAVGQTPVATDNPDRVQAADRAADLAKQIQSYEASMASIRQQPQDIQSMTHAPEKPRAPISVEMLGKNREFGSAPYDVAGPLSTLAQGAYDLKTAPLYAAGMAFPPAAALGTAIDTAEGVASGSPTQVAMGALGGPLKVARNVIAPLAVATGVTAPDEAEAGFISKLTGKMISPVERAKNLAKFRAGSVEDVPPVVYHGTGNDIHQFDTTKSAWFTDTPSLANEYANKPGGNVVPAHIALKNPIEFVHAEQRKPIGEVISTALSGARDLSAEQISAAKPIVDVLRERYGKDARPLFEYWNNDPDITKLFKTLGYDGISAFEKADRKAKTWSIFSPEQAKSAIGNAGTFDPTKARLNEAKGGSVEDRALMLVSRQA